MADRDRPVRCLRCSVSAPAMVGSRVRLRRAPTSSISRGSKPGQPDAGPAHRRSTRSSPTARPGHRFSGAGWSSGSASRRSGGSRSGWLGSNGVKRLTTPPAGARDETGTAVSYSVLPLHSRSTLRQPDDDVTTLVTPRANQWTRILRATRRCGLSGPNLTGLSIMTRGAMRVRRHQSTDPDFDRSWQPTTRCSMRCSCSQQIRCLEDGNEMTNMRQYLS